MSKKMKKIPAVEILMGEIYPGAYQRLEELIEDNDLMELDVKYIRDSNIAFKALLDGKVYKVITEVWDCDSAISRDYKTVPSCENDGPGPAKEVFDSIKLSDRWPPGIMCVGQGRLISRKKNY